MPAWSRILIHHSGAKDSNGADHESIARYHVKGRGWRAIGYHGIVELYGGEYRYFPGRPLTMEGSHEISQNREALGLCLAGDFTNEPPPADQVRLAAERCAKWCIDFGISPDEIHPHRDYRSTICPGKVPVDEIRRQVARILFEG